MALISAGYPFTFKRAPAVLHVIRNDGYCWGRIVQGLQEYDVQLKRRDVYDETDEDAARALINAAQRGHAEPPMASWRLAPIKTGREG